MAQPTRHEGTDATYLAKLGNETHEEIIKYIEQKLHLWKSSPEAAWIKPFGLNRPHPLTRHIQIHAILGICLFELVRYSLFLEDL
jgi:hypothetical protein